MLQDSYQTSRSMQGMVEIRLSVQVEAFVGIDHGATRNHAHGEAWQRLPALHQKPQAYLLAGSLFSQGFVYCFWSMIFSLQPKKEVSPLLQLQPVPLHVHSDQMLHGD